MTFDVAAQIIGGLLIVGLVVTAVILCVTGPDKKEKQYLRREPRI